MDPDELGRGRPSLPSVSNGSAVSYVAIDQYHVTVDKQEAVNVNVDRKLADLFAKHDTAMALLHSNNRSLTASVSKAQTDILLLERRVTFRAPWLWFLTVTSVGSAISTTLAWIILGHAE